MRDLVVDVELGEVDLPLEQQRLRQRRRRPLRPLVLHPRVRPRPLQLHVQGLEVDHVRPHVQPVVGPGPHERVAAAVAADAAGGGAGAGVAAAPAEAVAAAASSAAGHCDRARR